MKVDCDLKLRHWLCDSGLSYLILQRFRFSVLVIISCFSVGKLAFYFDVGVVTVNIDLEWAKSTEIGFKDTACFGVTPTLSTIH